MYQNPSKVVEAHAFEVPVGLGQHSAILPKGFSDLNRVF